jgi:hypothetical protein
LLANVEGVVYFEINGRALRLFDLLTLQKLEHTLRVVDLAVEEESHVVYCL